MREFFHGWRRKAGAATLVMACAFMEFWFRTGSSEEMTVEVSPETIEAIARRVVELMRDKIIPHRNPQ